MLKTNIAQRVAEAFSAAATKPKTIVVMYNNDGYRYAYDKVTHMFYVVNPMDRIIYMSLNPVKAHTQYEMYTSNAFRKRILKRGYNLIGEKIDVDT